MDNIWKSTVKQFLRSKTGVAGLILTGIILAFTVYSLAVVPANVSFTWDNPQTWTSNPVNAPPTWVSILGVRVSPTVTEKLTNWKLTNFSAGQTSVYEYSSSANISWNVNAVPQDVIFLPQFQGKAVTASLSWAKPNQSTIQIQISQIQSGTQYDANSQPYEQAISQYLLKQTGQYFSSLTKFQVISGLFNRDGKSVLSSPVANGVYHIQIQIDSTSKLNISSSSNLIFVGTSYGSMGTDYFGRPIDLGILAGLPNALELGVLTAIISVVTGIIFGGISGYFGGKKDGLMQWITLVFLALPALNFLVVLSYSTSLSLIDEALLIAFLSWPFFAIIARTVSLSIKSQTFVEADKAMGIPAYRSFFTHFMPRLLPVTIAYTVLGIPAGILLAETLGFLGIQPPNVITWGSILDAAFYNEAALYGWWWWVVFPGFMIVLSAVPFVLMGFSLERIVAPRVRNK